jgi:hypothetical protein
MSKTLLASSKKMSNNSPSLVGIRVLSVERKEQVVKSLKRAVLTLANDRRRKITANAAYARLCIIDAFQGRLSNGLANNSKKPWWIYNLFCIQTSDTMYNAVVLLSFLHSLSILFEPDNACPNSVCFTVLHYMVILVYSIDVAMKMSYEGVREYFTHDWQQLYVLNALCITIDFAVGGCTHYANPLRPVAGLLRGRKGRKFFQVLKKMVPGMVHNLMPVLYFVVVVISLSSLFFDGEVSSLNDISLSVYNWWFLLLTNDTFDRLLPTSAMFSPRYVFVFFVALYVGQRFLLSLVIGDTYNTYKSFVKQQLKKEHLKEMQGLTKAFTALDDENKGFITDTVWRQTMAALSPELSPEAVALYFELISGGASTISLLQFLSLRSIISFRLAVEQPTLMRQSMLILNRSTRALWESIQFTFPVLLVNRVQSLVSWLDEYNVSMKLALLDVLLFCSGQSDRV